MPITNPWLDGPAPTAACPRALLEDRILNLLSTQNLAVIATVAADGSPAATPIRFFSLGFEIMFTSWNASPKSRNLRRDPRVSAGIVAPLVGQASSRGAQIFGLARTLERDDPAADAYWEAFRWQSDHVERGRSISEPPHDPLTVITPNRIVYTDHWLRRDGYSPRQIWRPAPSE
jgi:general stress protein 26